MKNVYNYKHFKPEDYNFANFDGPKAGESAIDFQATTLDGKKVHLSDFFGKWIVLEIGSITCPITASKVPPMNRLASDFPEAVFLILYSREAHPGEKIKQHDSFDEKLSCAKRFRDEYDVTRTVLVDSIEGTAHQKYGGMPNSVYIINPDGKVVFRGDWNNIGIVREVLENHDPDRIYSKERFSARPYFGRKSRGIFGVLRLAGWHAVWDFVKAFPRMVIKHITKPR